MRDRLFLGWWVFFAAWCCLNVFWTFNDFKNNDWFSLCVDGPLATFFFFIAHLSWESEYYE